MEFLNEDELLEVTPNHLRLRKRILNTNAREKAAKRDKRAKQLIINGEKGSLRWLFFS